MSRLIHIIGGGTVNHVRAHFAVGAMAYGQAARTLNTLLKKRGRKPALHLTKMASSGRSKIETNEDLAQLVDNILKQPESCAILFNAAVADFEGQIGDVPSGKYATRLRSREATAGLAVTLTPAPKILTKIKQERPDIFLVAFKTTANETLAEQVKRASALIAESGADLVFANDTVTRFNTIVRPDGIHCCTTTDRKSALEKLAFLVHHYA